MDKVAVVIPNYNGYRYLETCFAALAKQTFTEFTTYFVDNGSQDESCAFLREHYPETKIIQLDDNYGFSRAVNEGIRQSKEPYVILLNNDTEVFQDFVERLYEGICKRKNAFACSAKLISYQERDKIDDAGNYYNMLGWAFARGKGKPVSEFETSDRIFAACAGAAIYRREFLEKTGLFDEEHFAYLEDTDIGYRARLLGYENWYEPSAKVYHVGSGTSGSRYNLFKIRYSSRNNIYLTVPCILFFTYSASSFFSSFATTAIPSSSSCFASTCPGASVIRSDASFTFGNAITSRMLSCFAISITRRSRP